MKTTAIINGELIFMKLYGFIAKEEGNLVSAEPFFTEDEVSFYRQSGKDGDINSFVEIIAENNDDENKYVYIVLDHNGNPIDKTLEKSYKGEELSRKPLIKIAEDKDIFTFNNNDKKAYIILNHNGFPIIYSSEKTQLFESFFREIFFSLHYPMLMTGKGKEWEICKQVMYIKKILYNNLRGIFSFLDERSEKGILARVVSEKIIENEEFRKKLFEWLKKGDLPFVEITRMIFRIIAEKEIELNYEDVQELFSDFCKLSSKNLIDAIYDKYICDREFSKKLYEKLMLYETRLACIAFMFNDSKNKTALRDLYRR